ncbi:putative peptidoglycan glycosyltransferase FtsW [Spirochaetota bacterium]|nr:putative peptidoglycan glycosyltransferase FtsW [Spirochaetota bacterium]
MESYTTSHTNVNHHHALDRYGLFYKGLHHLKTRFLSFKDGDIVLLLSVAALSLLGIAFLLLSSFNISMKYTGEPFYFVKRQLLWLLLSFMVMLLFALTPLNFFAKYNASFLLFIVILLVVVFVPFIGKSVSHTRRWTNLGILPFFIQPSEIIKPFFLLVMTQYIHNTETHDTLVLEKKILPVLIALGVTLLIALEPDISTAVIIMTTSIVILILGRFSLKYFLSGAILSLPIWLWVLQNKQYIVNRFLFLTPEADPAGSGYHIIRSLHAHKTGGWFGQPTEKVFTNLAKLPDAHNDFAFAALTHTNGFLAAFIVIALTLLVLERGVRIAKTQTNNQYTLLALAIVFMISLEAAIHIAVTLGLLPTTGTPLPFISYGGSSLLSHYAMIGLLFNLSLVRASSKSNSP